MGELFNPANWVKAGILLWEWLKSQTKEVFLLLVLSLLARFLPISWLNGLGLDPHNHIYHVTVLRILWGSFLYLLIFGGAQRWRSIESWYWTKKRFRFLANDEKQILPRFCGPDQNQSTAMMWPHELGLGTLAAAGLLFRIAGLDDDLCAFGLSTAARKFIRKHRKEIPTLLTIRTGLSL